MTAFAVRDFEAGFGRQQDTLPGAQLDWLQAFRRRALTQLRAQGLPHRKTEDWKYTSVRRLLEQDFLAPQVGPVEVPQLAGRNLVSMVNGCFSESLSQLDSLPDGVRVAGMNDVLACRPEDLEHRLGAIACLEQHPFAALNGAFFHDGLVIDVPAGMQVREPLTLLWLSAGAKPRIAQPRVLVTMGEGASLCLLERHLGSSHGHLTNRVTEVDIADGARLSHIWLQHPGRDHLISGTHVRCGRDAHLQSFSFDLGGALLRNDLVVSLEAPGAECSLDGVFMAGDGEHVDNHVRVDHRAPHGRSGAYYKGVLGRGGHGVFNGKLIVHPDAQKTDAQQVNRNLLLSPGAEVDSKPELEIYADDVKCSHGSTSGELEADPLFYLRSRGIGREDARALLVDAFVREISDRLAGDSVRETVSTALSACLEDLVSAQDQKEAQA